VTFRIVKTRPGWRDLVVPREVFAWLEATFTADIDFLFGKPIPEYQDKRVPVSVSDSVYAMMILRWANYQNG